MAPATFRFTPATMAQTERTFAGPVSLTSCSDAPREMYKWGYMLSISNDSGGIQIYVPNDESGAVFVRSKYETNPYGKWKKIAGSVIG